PARLLPDPQRRRARGAVLVRLLVSGRGRRRPYQPRPHLEPRAVGRGRAKQDPTIDDVPRRVGSPARARGPTYEMALFTLGSTFSAISSMERRASFLSFQSWPG